MIRSFILKNTLTIYKTYNTCKASQKANTLSRVAPCTDVAKRRLLMNSCFASQFKYCVLERMWTTKWIILDIGYCDSGLSFEDLLDKDKSVPTIHATNVQLLATEIFKMLKNLSVPKEWAKFLRNDIMLVAYENLQNFWQQSPI